jgi:hypothetical protein
MCHPLLAYGYQADEAVQPPARQRPFGWRLIRRAVTSIASSRLRNGISSFYRTLRKRKILNSDWSQDLLKPLRRK